ncbi:MAG: mannose-1-phosphate guanylyltransferase [Candidatus Cloacimonetes bacterium]|nr:mannose-1-phosphate guanylyltransferase [Candidatus Cloacimonadota bacterium]
MIALIMAGGSGTRFWPASRASEPKQFLQISARRSMLQLTVDRLLPLIPIEDIYIVTAASQVSLVQQHLPNLALENIIIEPFGMNTAPCIALSAEFLKQRYSEDNTMIVLPADHVIRDPNAFHQALKKADAAAKNESLITFGIVPDYPATGYGYIEAGAMMEAGLLSVTRFKEKPDRETAEGFLKQGNFYWNSGMFCWSISAIDKAFKSYLPEVAQLCQQISKRWRQDSYTCDISDLYQNMPRIPIDIGIMEKAESRYVIPVDLGWSDVGSWKALADISPTDAQGNYSAHEYLTLNAHGNFIHSKKFTALIGVQDLCVVETPDAILVCHKDNSEDVKQVVDHLKQASRGDLL